MKHEKYEELIPILGITEVHQMRVYDALRNFSWFHEDLSRTIEWTAQTVWPLISSDSTFKVRLACALMDIHPDAQYWDRVLVLAGKEEEGETEAC